MDPDNVVPNTPAEQDNMLSTAIMDFLLREREDQAQQQQQPDPVPEVVPELQPEPQKPFPFCIFFNANLEVEIPEPQAIPSTVARYFGIKPSDLQLKRKNKTYKIHETEDIFLPAVKARNKYEVVAVPSKRESICAEKNDQCTIILNNQQASILGGTVTKTQISTSLSMKKPDFRLIGQDGTIISHKNQFNLNPGATYHVIHPGQSVLKSTESPVDESPKEISSNLPMSYMAPHFISVLRILHTLSFTKDAIEFKDDVIQETKGSTLLCTNTLSTCAYQVAFGFNEIAKAIQNVTSKIAKNSYKKSYDPSTMAQKYEVVSKSDGSDEEEEASEEEEEHYSFFEDADTCDSPLNDIAKIVELFQKSIVELDDFSQLVMKQMRAKNPTVESVKLSLEIKAEDEKRKLQLKKLAKINPEELQKICKNVSKCDEQICPNSPDLYAVSSNRNHLNHGIELVDKILEDYNKDCVFADVAKLLNHCAQILHCSLMHWMFAFEVMKSMDYDEKIAVAGRVIENPESKKVVASQLYRCFRIWDTVSLAVPLYLNLDDKADENVFEIWKNMKDKIIASQYALEIYYASAVKEKRSKKGGGTM